MVTFKKMRISFSIALLFPLSLVMNGQINCCPGNILSVHKKEVELVYTHYRSLEDFNNVIVLIDVLTTDSVNYYRCFSSQYVYESIYKKPDCYFFDENCICYIYTDSLDDAKDFKWLDVMFRSTCKLLNAPKIQIFWENDSVGRITGSFLLTDVYHPRIIEFIVRNGKIINYSFQKQMLYPETSIPKGVPNMKSPSFYIE